MASVSYASVLSKPVEVPESKCPDTIEAEITDWIAIMSQVTQPPEQLTRLVEILRREMETPQTGFRNGAGGVAGQRNFGGASGGSGGNGSGGGSGGSTPPQNWRNSFSGSNRFSSMNPASQKSAFDTRTAPVRGSRPGAASSGQTSPVQQQQQQIQSQDDKTPSPRPPAGRYHSRFKSSGNLEDKILNTIIGNKLNAFTPLTYNDTRDFIYQIMESGETEFTRDFIEKVFLKATLEELYCSLFAKLIAEIAHKYPVIYEEIHKYNKEFLKIFDDVEEDSEASYESLIKQKQYRMGYGQFIAELTGSNAIEKSELTDMVSIVIEKIYSFTALENKTKVVEEFIDCIIRLTKGLRERYCSFFKNVKGELSSIVSEKVNFLISKSDVRPSLSNKARFGLMDLRDILQ